MPTTQISIFNTFRKYWGYIEGWFFPVDILKETLADRFSNNLFSFCLSLNMHINTMPVKRLL